MPNAFICGTNVSTFNVIILTSNTGRPFVIHADLIGHFASRFRAYVGVGGVQGVQGGTFVSAPYATDAALAIFTRWIYARSTNQSLDLSRWYSGQPDDFIGDLSNALRLGQWLGSPDFCQHVNQLIGLYHRMDFIV
ncbi:hypothetical protein Hte_002912 [Hypoxylon texense]